MVDRIQFTNQINYKDSTQEKEVNNHFDEIMLLYNNLSNLNLQIDMERHGEDEYIFCIHANEQHSTNEILELSSKQITIYSRIVEVCAEIKGDCLYIIYK